MCVSVDILEEKFVVLRPVIRSTAATLHAHLNSTRAENFVSTSQTRAVCTNLNSSTYWGCHGKIEKFYWIVLGHDFMNIVVLNLLNFFCALIQIFYYVSCAKATDTYFWDLILKLLFPISMLTIFWNRSKHKSLLIYFNKRTIKNFLK